MCFTKVDDYHQLQYNDQHHPHAHQYHVHDSKVKEEKKK
jgi:hypothetical protein